MTHAAPTVGPALEEITMTAGIRVTPEQLDSLGARVAAGSGQIETELRALAGSIAPLGTDWAGMAQIRFLTLWQEWQRAAEQLHTALTGISQLLGQAGSAYAQAETQIAQSFAAQ